MSLLMYAYANGCDEIARFLLLEMKPIVVNLTALDNNNMSALEHGIENEVTPHLDYANSKTKRRHSF